jgi:hypothetical protein
MENERLAKLEVKQDALHADVSEIKKDVKSLLEFKWRIAGFAAFAAFMATTFIELLK